MAGIGHHIFRIFCRSLNILASPGGEGDLLNELHLFIPRVDRESQNVTLLLPAIGVSTLLIGTAGTSSSFPIDISSFPPPPKLDPLHAGPHTGLHSNTTESMDSQCYERLGDRWVSGRQGACQGSSSFSPSGRFSEHVVPISRHRHLLQGPLYRRFVSSCSNFDRSFVKGDNISSKAFSPHCGHIFDRRAFGTSSVLDAEDCVSATTTDPSRPGILDVQPQSPKMEGARYSVRGTRDRFSSAAVYLQAFARDGYIIIIIIDSRRLDSIIEGNRCFGHPKSFSGLGDSVVCAVAS